MKRARAPNFSTQELMHLIQLAKKYPIIESKKTDGATNKHKKDAWKALAVEYNSTTLTGPRTARNLLDCYKNQKIKAKKLYCSKKMQIKAPQTDVLTSKSNATSEALETNGQDWEFDSESRRNTPSQGCTAATFDDLVRQAKKQEIIFKKEILRLGGGPQLQPSDELILEKPKSMVGSGVEGLYITVHGCDSGSIDQQQNEHPIEKRLPSIDVPSGHGMEDSSITPQRYNTPPILHVVTPDILNVEDEDITSTAANTNNKMLKRLNSLKNKIDSSINVYNDTKRNISKSVLQFVEDKKNLLHTQKLVADSKLRHQQILTQIAKEKLEFERQKQTIELNYLKEKYELELSLLRSTNKT